MRMEYIFVGVVRGTVGVGTDAVGQSDTYIHFGFCLHCFPHIWAL